MFGDFRAFAGLNGDWRVGVNLRIQNLKQWRTKFSEKNMETNGSWGLYA